LGVGVYLVFGVAGGFAYDVAVAWREEKRALAVVPGVVDQARDD